MAERIETVMWKAKDGTMHESEKRANWHDAMKILKKTSTNKMDRDSVWLGERGHTVNVNILLKWMERNTEAIAEVMTLLRYGEGANIFGVRAEEQRRSPDTAPKTGEQFLGWIKGRKDSLILRRSCEGEHWKCPSSGLTFSDDVLLSWAPLPDVPDPEDETPGAFEFDKLKKYCLKKNQCPDCYHDYKTIALVDGTCPSCGYSTSDDL